MVRLLVVDDEITSRDSLIRNILKMEFDISFIDQAEDGIRALEAAALNCPDIVLADVRMPRMDGIEMSFRLKELYPEVKIIFLSGYSDKDYLKSAIQLRALSYVEKPVDYGELERVMREAIDLVTLERKNREDVHNHERLAKNFPLLKHELALKMINPVKLSREPFDYTLLGIRPDAEFVTVLLQVIGRGGITSYGLYTLMENAVNRLEQLMEAQGLIGLGAVKDNEYLLLHIACTAEQRQQLEPDSLRGYLSIIPALLEQSDYFIAVGKPVTGIENVPESYNSAALTLQKSFFAGYGKLVFYKENRKAPYTFREEMLTEFNRMVFREEKEQSVALIRNFSAELRLYENTLSTHVKEFFYRLLTELVELANELAMDSFSSENSRNLLWDSVSSFYTLQEAKEFTCLKLEEFFLCRKEKRDNKSKISQIIRYIETNYRNPDLSVKMISEHTFLSLAYMCSVFKQETGSTINQYLTDYRTEKAKELLKDRGYNISEVAQNVGIGDSQYFAKLFKKKTGVTPSEFRERGQQ